APVQDEPNLPEGYVIEKKISSRTRHARIQTDDYADHRNISVGLFGKLQRLMHCKKEKGLSKLPNEGRKPELHILSWECIASLMNANPWLLLLNLGT
nr:hypothetical protein [Tanacetum cinerariifolium]